MFVICEKLYFIDFFDDFCTVKSKLSSVRLLPNEKLRVSVI